MLKRIALAVSIICCFFPLSRSYSEDTKATDSDIAWLMNLYGYTLPTTTVQTMHQSFAPRSFTCGDVEVTLTEILYDGLWLYIAATATPIHPETSLLMPGSADFSDFVAGGYGEGLRDDSRSFEQVALQDEKSIIRIFLYPAEFYDAPYYYLDHRQDAGDQSTLFGGAPGHWMDENITIHLCIQLEHIELANGECSSPESYEFPIEIERLGSIESRTFQTTYDNDAPFTSIDLVKTPLTAYANIHWKNELFENNIQYELLDNMMNPFAQGAPPGGNAFSMTDLPEEINIRFHLYNGQDEILLLSSIEEP